MNEPEKKEHQMPKDNDLVCCCCASPDIRMLDKHGYVECKECGVEGYAIAYEDWEPSETQQGLIPIPSGYAEA